MTDLLWSPDEQLDRIKPCFPQSHGVPRVDDHRVVSGIVFVAPITTRIAGNPNRFSFPSSPLVANNGAADSAR